MKEIGQKIKEARKRKGMSQEDLAEEAKVNLRTIQRIESNETEPRNKTLQMICDALEINIENILDHGKTEDRNYLVLLHLSVLSFLFIPIGNIILPLILWIYKRDKIINLNKVGANLLNFQINLTLISTVLLFSFIFSFTTFNGNWFEFILLVISIYVLNIILSLTFAFLTKNREKPILYPKLIRFIQ
ncbi:helix-turn-helix domain-containing protein [Aureivirga sp. CE67]|uniref:helix-turn-helix domain-containing protein n=1 Tax=Aureivirga sp. CE67 TaxID=1788983 RepID=UPI0018CB4B26|nr:helix-turn-helix domain-containing protein [Aureivirga sp. CE67]